MSQRRTYNFDAELELVRSQIFTASGRAQFGGVDRYIDLGPGRKEGTVVVDIDNIDVGSTDERYQIIFQGSNDANFATSAQLETLGILDLGATASRAGGPTKPRSSPAGRYEMKFVTEVAGTVYRYVSVYVVVSGTGPSITVRAWIDRDFGT